MTLSITFWKGKMNYIQKYSAATDLQNILWMGSTKTYDTNDESRLPEGVGSNVTSQRHQSYCCSSTVEYLLYI